MKCWTCSRNTFLECFQVSWGFSSICRYVFISERLAIIWRIRKNRLCDVFFHGSEYRNSKNHQGMQLTTRGTKARKSFFSVRTVSEMDKKQPQLQTKNGRSLEQVQQSHKGLESFDLCYILIKQKTSLSLFGTTSSFPFLALMSMLNIFIIVIVTL